MRRVCIGKERELDIYQDQTRDPRDDDTVGS